MKKFWNIVKISLVCLLALGGIALLVCYIVINEQTVMAIDKVVDYLNRPLFIIGGTTITLGLVVFVLLRYALKLNRDKVKDYVEQAKALVREKEQSAKENYDNAKKVQEETKLILTSYDTKIEEIVDQVVLMCEKMPNAKINKLGQEFKDTYVSAKVELKDKLDNIDDYIANKEQSVDYKEKYIELESKLNEIIERLGANYGESEEITNG